MKISRDFVSEEQRSFQYKIGRYLASSLSGFIAGVVVASVIWFGAIVITNLYRNSSASTNAPLFTVQKYGVPAKNVLTATSTLNF